MPSQSVEEVGPVYAFIRSWNRPLYLWACLDSLYRSTSYPCRFVFIDNNSDDPLVRQVVQGFQRRGMFHAVHFMNRNHAFNQSFAFLKHRDEIGKYLVLLDADVVVEQSEPCWLTRLIQIGQTRPELAIIGSYIDQSDFVDRQRAEEVIPDLPEQRLQDLIKAKSPERTLKPSSQDVIDSVDPPGRLLLVRTSFLEEVGLRIGNKRLCNAARSVGYQVGIATKVRHRHLSLLNLFDYADYDFDQLRSYLRGQ